ncbi:MAG: hypothetical protein NVS4B10_18360 [Myxococcales bacterium]
MPRPLPPAALAVAACWLAACADLSRAPLFPRGAADAPIVQEQDLLGLAPGGEAAVAQLILAEGEEPRLSLLRLDGAGRGEPVLVAPPGVARAVAGRVLAQGGAAEPVLAEVVAALWPGAGARRLPPR